jgi:diguanylate cyclase (GGDEF)-like protein/PAS domain S-box-containing protein
MNGLHIATAETPAPAGDLQHLTMVMESAPVVLFVLNRAGVVTLSQGAGLESLGRRSGELVGHSVWDMYEDAPDLLRSFQRALAGETFTDRLRIKNYTFDTRFVPMFERAIVTSVIGVATDTTEQARAEEQQREGEARYRTLFENAHDVVFTLDLAGNLTAINRTAEQMCGYTREEAIRMSIADVVAPEYLQTTSAMIADKLDGVPATTYLIELVARDGERIPLEVTTQLTYHQGMPSGVQGIGREVSARRQAESALRLSEARFRSAFDDAAIGMSLVGIDGSWLQVNRSLCDIVGYTEQELLATSFQAITYAADLEADLSYVRQVLAGEISSYHMEKRYLHKLGHVVWVLLTVSLVRDTDGSPLYFVSQVQDISRQKRVEVELARERDLLQALMDHLPDNIYFKDQDSRFLRINKALADLFGLESPEQAIGKTDFDFFTAEHAGPALHDERQILNTNVPVVGRVEKETWRERADRWVLTTKMPMYDTEGHTIGTFGISRDISEMKIAEDALTHQALHDGLTGLPNRTLLRDRLQLALTEASEHSSRFALFFLDLNRFKDINDTFGHHSGDLVLQTLGARLQAEVGEHGTAARLGGDELAVVLPTTDERAAIAAAEKILTALNEPFTLEGQVFDIGSSIGIALYPDHGDDPAVLMRRADIAMYAAKRGGDGYVMYAPEMEQSNPTRIALTRELRTAIASDQLVLHYQPQIHLESHCAEHLEALVRWNHPEHGFMPPDSFIPVAEESGLIRPLTTWVLNEALRQVSEWNRAGRDIRISVNLSTRSLHDPDLVDTVRSCLERWSVSSSNLALEITESAIIIDPDRALDTATRLHDLGVRISIDDFGTGYSSLAYLKRLPIDEVKIDRSFVSDVIANADSAFIVRSVIDLAHNLGIQVVAEGVEDALVLDSLVAQDCELAQGYFISRPLTAAAVLPWLLAHAH